MSNSGGPWGGGGGNRGGGDDRRPPDRRPDEVNEIDELVNRGREGLKVLMGGKGDGRRGGGGSGGGNGGGGFEVTKSMWVFAALAAVGFWAMNSFYTVRPEEQAVEFFLGDPISTEGPGLNFAPWPLVTVEKMAVTSERIIDIGTSRSGSEAGLMLTGDENIVDIDFQVVWRISNLETYLINLASPPATIEAVSESAMREIIAQSDLAPILNRDRGPIADRLKDLIQQTLDSYNSGVEIIRVNFDKADPPEEVIAAFRAVQDAEQERDRLQNVADAYANQVVANARGSAAQSLEEAEAYRAKVVNEAEGEASRFAAVLEEYAKAPEVTRKRLYLETMENVLGNLDLVILDGDGQGAVPYLPLNQLTQQRQGGN